MQHPLIPSKCTGDFAQDRWLDLTHPLRQQANALVEFAAARGLLIRASSRWPEVGLRRNSFFSVHEARVSLTPEVINGSAPTWAVRALRYSRWSLLAPHAQVVADVALLTQDELGNTQRLLDELSNAIAAL